MSRFAWERTTKFKRSPSNASCGAYIRYTFGVTHGNTEQPGHFSITGEEYAPFFIKYEEDWRMRQHIREVGDEQDCLDDISPHTSTDYCKIRNRWWSLISCGCMHDELQRVHKKLLPFVKWHLCTDGVPMHYILNTLYYIKNAFDIWRKQYDIVDRIGEIFCEHSQSIDVKRWEELDSMFVRNMNNAHCTMLFRKFDKHECMPPMIVKKYSMNAWGASVILNVFNEEGIRDWLISREEMLREAYRKDMETLQGMEL
jgi:hypothetical protein